MPIPLPTPGANSTIMMTAADLLAFCQQMMMAARQDSPNNNSGTPLDDLRQEVREYLKEVKVSLDTKSVTTFNESNYQATQCLKMGRPWKRRSGQSVQKPYA
ncbi:hypothetical protein PAAG_12468 [Paracoccidioides lutzii Pb01]|uniref:Uncharacterized protein n=1 Tax=Paracoccidioides lutzii (strain ATCC MYA-826 / Pb01) TaxID=502779 RepID=A0A0A2VIY6_PARBA|nr:hypothetical protein PAAG_12468 [Paracoccidioides lutzii Pb01]KGQ00879.1 hypothetical protein PAAG_12468 [Paracoccidioides lutzii Pb01]